MDDANSPKEKRQNLMRSYWSNLHLQLEEDAVDEINYYHLLFLCCRHYFNVVTNKDINPKLSAPVIIAQQPTKSCKQLFYVLLMRVSLNC